MELRNEWPFHVGTVSYLSVDSNENYIYGLYSGFSRSDKGLDGNTIHKFDWDLNLVDAYKLDQRFNQISVDEKGNFIRLEKLMKELSFSYLNYVEAT